MFNNVKTVATILLYSLISLPSLLYHTFLNKYRKYSANDKININPLNNKPLYNKNVVVLVHGRNGSPRDFDPLISNIQKCSNTIFDKDLQDYGYDKVGKVIKYGDKFYVLRTVDLGETGNTSISKDAMELEKQLEIYHKCSITLVGLSKGGLVAMKYVTSVANSQIKKVITISTPCKGTYAASLFPSSSSVFKNLSYNNEIVQQIDLKRKFISQKIYHIVPKFDQIIIPNTSAKYDDTPEENIYYYNGCEYSHSGIAYSYNVANAIICFIKN